ncbi:hypothetical protein HQQ94_12605 [Shewanella sp. VB17]|uniref:hypothetical protein n=1 Tax=Shewanella sp. VB17 TaxID=2739432 RepID=UPI0015638D5E|nr:hypothetical protein [Shewanella sp. VB17]NRD74060.1 hypothetical protein [Shewanella sp. VB17]
MLITQERVEQDDNYTPPKWIYDNGRTGRGYNLRMLSITEIKISADLLKTWLSNINISDNPSWYKPFASSTEYQSHQSYFLRLLRTIKQCEIEGEGISIHEMNTLNQELSRIFSDEGWRHMKQKFSQQAKRKRKARPEISSSLLSKLHHVKTTQGFTSLDEVIDELLSFYHDNQNSNGACCEK